MKNEMNMETSAMTIRNFKELVSHLSGLTKRCRVIVVCGSDESTQYAVEKAVSMGFAEATFVGCREEVEANAQLMALRPLVHIVDAEDRDDAARKAIALIHEGKGDVMMKGLINSDNLLHAILNKETGLLPQGRVLTHIAVAEIPTYPKLLFFTDAAVIPYPTQEQRVEQVRYMSAICHSFGIAEPKMTLIHCTEKVNGRLFPFTEGYEAIKEQARQGTFGRCVVDGPFDVKVACDVHSMHVKGIESPIGGEADALIFPDIESGNLFYKTLTLFCGATASCILQGTVIPVSLPSRSDSPQSKFYSLAFAVISSL